VGRLYCKTLACGCVGETTLNLCRLRPRKLYDNLRNIGFINRLEKFDGDVDVGRLSNFILMRQSLSGIDFNVPVSSNVPEF
jgi:hypothetical protein